MEPEIITQDISGQVTGVCALVKALELTFKAVQAHAITTSRKDGVTVTHSPAEFAFNVGTVALVHSAEIPHEMAEFILAESLAALDDFLNQ